MLKSLSVIALLPVAVVAHADLQGGGFQGPDNYQLVTVAEASGLPDDARVRLQGFVVRSVGDETYEFRDDTGTLLVEIDDDEWGGLEVTPELEVQVHGEMDHERQEVELDAEGIRAAE